MKIRYIALLALILLPALVFAQNAGISKYALVIGNGNYTNLTKLTNPVNDANDMAATLAGMGFTVDKILDGSLDQMETSIMKLKNRLSVTPNSYGFFFYAGHGVQSGGENYLIPADANIPGENFLKIRAIAVQTMLDELNDARNELNVVVLDACRDNPFGWSRSGTRGLTIVSKQPADSIIVFATSAGQRASDGEGRNGLFTKELLNNLKTPGLDISEVFRRTGADVAAISNRQQVPAVYNQFFGIAYLGAGASVTIVQGAAPSQPSAAPAAQSPAAPAPIPVKPPKPPKEPRAPIASDPATRLWSVGASVGSSFADPWVIGTVRGTIAPFNYVFFELGVDLGFVSGVKDVGYYSFYPYAHATYYRPLAEKVGIYAGAGGGYLIAKYSYSGKDFPVNIFAMDATAGVSLFNMLDISYTFRTNFKNVSNKVSVGYFYRF